MKNYPFDVLGNVVIVKFPDGTRVSEKKKFANSLIKRNVSSTVLEKTGKFSGRLRKQKTTYIAGEKTKESLYKENGCIFRFNIDDTYFSPRLSNERKEIADKIKKGEKVLVMFAGVSPFSIVIGKNSKADIVYSNELNRKANQYGEFNIERNKLKGKVVLVPGDIKKVAKKLSEKKEKFDVVVMPRPQLKDSFLQEAFLLSKKGTRIYYYDFCKFDEVKNLKEMIESEAKKARKKIRFSLIKKAGETGPYKFRMRFDFKVL